MKKLLILTMIAAFFAACSNTPAVSESATKLTGLSSWVDSIGKLVSTATAFDSATWASYDEQYNTALSAINEAELDETSKATLETVKTTWSGVATTYSSAMEEFKKQAAEAAAANDSTANAAGGIIEKGKEVIKDGKEVAKDAKDMMKK